MSHNTVLADRFIAEHRHQLRHDYRLNYHLMSEFGWMNDPNGFIFHNGRFHLFYQHHPYQPCSGPMHWGHAVSGDMIKWRYRPVALAPDQPYDRDGCFSGSAIERNGELVVMYTGHIVTGPDGSRDYYQVQNLAVSRDDGLSFEKWTGNPVIGRAQIPEGVSRKDFRDPKLLERDGRYYAVLGSNDGQGNGLLLAYRSEDLSRWEFSGVLARSDGTLGENWECPDLFSLDGQDVLILSPERMPVQGDDYRYPRTTVYMVGDLDLERGVFIHDGYDPIDYGFDFYAPQTTQDDRGRRIVIAWMETWGEEIPTQNGHYWAGAMTLPREVRIVDRKLRFYPMSEIAAHRGPLEEIHDCLIEGEQDLNLRGDSYELEVVFYPGSALELGLKLRVGGTEETVLGYRTDTRRFRFNRDRSGIGPGGERRTAIDLEGGQLLLRAFVDKSSVEVFLQDGRKVMTGRIYPGPNALGIRAFATGGACRIESLRKWDIR